MTDAPQTTAPSLGNGVWQIDGVDYREVDAAEIPDSWTDPRLSLFRCACSNGFVGDMSIGSAFQHKPGRWPQCFPQGVEGDAVCRTVTLLRCSEGIIHG